MMSFYMEFITAVSCYGANVGGVLLLKDAVCKCVFGVIVVDRYSDLRDDRAVVKTGAHEVDCAACDFYARFDRLTLGMKSTEARRSAGWILMMRFGNAFTSSSPQIRIYPARQMRSGA